MTLGRLSKKWTNKIKVLFSRLNAQSVLLLISLGILTTFALYKGIGKEETKQEVVVGEKQTAEVLALQKSDLDGNGLDETITFYLLPKGELGHNARLSVSNEGKEIASKEVSEIFDGNFEIVNLFDNDKRQVFLKVLVGAHGMAGYIYEFENGLLLPICPEEAKGCVFFSDAPDMYTRDLDLDGIQEIVIVGRDYDDISKSLYSFYAWSGRNYTQVVGEKYDRFLSLETGDVSAKSKLPTPTTKPKAKLRVTVPPTPTPTPEPKKDDNGEQQTLSAIEGKINLINQKITYAQVLINNALAQEQQDTCSTDRYTNPESEMYIEDPYARETLCAGRSQQYFSYINQIQSLINTLVRERNELERQKFLIMSQ